eukprot:3743405-Pyramimonas_sp.AAC.1
MRGAGPQACSLRGTAVAGFNRRQAHALRVAACRRLSKSKAGALNSLSVEALWRRSQDGPPAHYIMATSCAAGQELFE